MVPRRYLLPKTANNETGRPPPSLTAFPLLTYHP